MMSMPIPPHRGALRVDGLPDLAHAALAEEGRSRVMGEAAASFESHGLWKRTCSFYAHVLHEAVLERQEAEIKQLAVASAGQAQDRIVLNTG